MWKFSAIIALCCVLSAGGASAEPQFGEVIPISELTQSDNSAIDTLDVAFLQATAIVYGKVSRVQRLSDHYYAIHVDANEVLKGFPSQTFVAICASDESDLGLSDPKNRTALIGQYVLCIFTRLAWEQWALPSVETDDPEGPNVFAIRRGHRMSPIIRLDSIYPYAGMTTELRYLDGAVSILDYLRRLHDRYRTDATPKLIRLHNPECNLEPYYFQRIINTPLTPTLIGLARSWVKSRDPATRLNGVHVLATAKTPQHVALLQSLLNDSAAVAGNATFKLHARSFVVREAAFQALHDWEIVVPRPVIDEPEGLRRRFSALGAVSVSLVGLFFILLWAAGSSKPNQGFVSRLRKLARWVLVGLALLTGGVWIRSAWFVYQLEIPIGQNRLQLTTTPHGLQSTWITGWPTRDQPSLVALPTKTDLDQLWEYKTGPDVTIADDAGESRWYAWASGSQIGSGGTSPPSPHWQSRRVPYGWLILLMTLFPTGALIRTILRPYLVNVQICSQCGYDLRATKDRCPECGTPKQTSRRQLKRERIARESMAREAAEKRRAFLALKVQACSDGLGADESPEDADPAGGSKELPT